MVVHTDVFSLAGPFPATSGPVAKDRPSDDSAETLVLQEALATTGSVSHLAIILNVSVGDLERWLTGNELTPTSVLQAAVELIEGAGVAYSSFHFARSSPMWRPRGVFTLTQFVVLPRA
jgi:hypothetical protein